MTLHQGLAIIDAVEKPSMVAIPEALAVQELAFRQGQSAHKTSQGRIPPSPFAEAFDQLWEEFFELGKSVGGVPMPRPTAPFSISRRNYDWPVLVNPYTQDLACPDGSVDLNWGRQICIISLKCMEALIRTVCKRERDWDKVVCDILQAAQEALGLFPDLRRRYEVLKGHAREVLWERPP